MKVFVYSKKDNKKVATINHVEFVSCLETEAKISIVDENGFIYRYNTNEVKTTVYQN